jgi:hypothetical protein
MFNSDIKETPMNWHNNPFAKLAARIRRGEPAAAEQFRQQMTPQLVRLVRRVVRYGPCTSAWEQKIQAETERLLSCRANAPDSDQVIGQVAQRLCQDMVDNLRQELRAEDTWSAGAEASRWASPLG